MPGTLPKKQTQAFLRFFIDAPATSVADERWELSVTRLAKSSVHQITKYSNVVRSQTKYNSREPDEGSHRYWTDRNSWAIVTCLSDLTDEVTCSGPMGQNIPPAPHMPATSRPRGGSATSTVSKTVLKVALGSCWPVCIRIVTTYGSMELEKCL